MKVIKWRLPILSIVLVYLLSACTTIPVDERPQVRKKIEVESESIIAAFTAEDPSIKNKLDESIGYFTGSTSIGMFGLAGGGGMIGLLYEKEKAERAFLNMTAIDIGVGIGGANIKVLALFETDEALDRVKSGEWFGAPQSAGIVGKSGGLQTISREGMDIHVLSDSGVEVGAAFSVTKISINEELTDMGISEIGIPHVGSTDKYKQGKDAPRKWNRKLPFLAQKAIDKGFDLPLPYGVGVTFVGVDQEMTLTGLEVGINGSNKRPFEFVAFEDASAVSQSVQLKLDAWLFPFMNVFAMVGKVGGDAPMDVILDGNTVLDNMGLDCTRPINQGICGRFEDQTVTLPIEANIDAVTYGVGTTFAAGFNNWFAAIPLSVNFVDPAGSVADGISFTFTPRGGRIVNLGRFGQLAGFVGGNYLYSAYEIDGSLNIPDSDIVLDYTIDQENKDSWNLLLGFNWNINRYISWAVEYDGFIGSRESIITSIGIHF